MTDCNLNTQLNLPPFDKVSLTNYGDVWHFVKIAHYLILVVTSEYLWDSYFYQYLSGNSLNDETTFFFFMKM